jgi:hypothetical protein
VKTTIIEKFSKAGASIKWPLLIIREMLFLLPESNFKNVTEKSDHEEKR